MAEKKEEKPSATQEFRKKALNLKNATETISEGLKSPSGKVRSLAIKLAFKTQKHDFIKKNILPLMESDKSKKVLRTIGGKMNRKKLNEKLASITVKKVAGKKEEAAAPAEAPKA